MIKAIVFDFYGVICSDEYWQLVKHDRNVESDFSKLADELHLGEITWEEFVKQISDRTGQPAEEINKAYQSEKLNMRLVAYISQLHKKYKTALLSNAAYESFKPRAEQIGFNDLFDYTVVSSKIGMIKPDPGIYDYVLDKLVVSRNEVVYIDDVRRFVEAATKLGIKSIHYQDFPQMKAELEKILASPDN